MHELQLLVHKILPSLLLNYFKIQTSSFMIYSYKNDYEINRNCTKI